MIVHPLGTLRCQKRASDPLELELQVSVIPLKWVLGNKLVLEDQQMLLTTETSLLVRVLDVKLGSKYKE